MGEVKQLQRKTISLGDGSNVDVSICRGHVDAATFSLAFAAEGWSPSEHTEKDIKREYWIENGDGSWTRSEKGNPKAKPVTVSYW